MTSTTQSSAAPNVSSRFLSSATRMIARRISFLGGNSSSRYLTSSSDPASIHCTLSIKRMTGSFASRRNIQAIEALISSRLTAGLLSLDDRGKRMPEKGIIGPTMLPSAWAICWSFGPRGAKKSTLKCRASACRKGAKAVVSPLGDGQEPRRTVGGATNDRSCPSSGNCCRCASNSTVKRLLAASTAAVLPAPRMPKTARWQHSPWSNGARPFHTPSNVEND